METTAPGRQDPSQRDRCIVEIQFNMPKISINFSYRMSSVRFQDLFIVTARAFVDITFFSTSQIAEGEQGNNMC